MLTIPPRTARGCVATICAAVLMATPAAAESEPLCTVDAEGPTFVITPTPGLPDIRPEGGVGASVDCPLLQGATQASGL